jgi:peroxiredoxin Q/BCP
MMKNLCFILSCTTLSTSNAFSLNGINSKHQAININDEAIVSSTNSIGRKTFLNEMFKTTALSSIILANVKTASASTLETGQKAPYFNLPNSQNKGVSISLDQLSGSGKWTVLYFYPGAFTSGCTLEARGFQRDLDNFRALNTQIVGVSVDSVEKNAQFCTEEKLDFMLLTDEGGKISKAYGSALSIPGFGTFSNRQTYLIDPNGDVQYVFTDVERSVARHSDDVLQKLKELQS